MELLKVQSVQTVREKLLECVSDWTMGEEYVSIENSLGRVLSGDVKSGEDVPGFRRSTVDGYALRARDTAAAGESIPSLLDLAGRVNMGEAAKVELGAGQCVQVATGAMLPDGADAVVMVEYTEEFTDTSIGIYQSVAVGENVITRGEDIRAGAHVLSGGTKIGAREVGVLAAAGVTKVPVFTELRLAVISTGDELVAPGEILGEWQVRDINSYTLAALARKAGFQVVHTAVIKDDERLLEAELRRTMAVSDVVVVSGGSSQGEKDATKKVINSVSSQGVFTHGMAIKPGKPTIVGYDAASRTVLAGLPGHPVSSMMVFEVLFSWLVRSLTGMPEPIGVPATLSVNLASSPGKATYWPVKLVAGGDGYLAQPQFGKSGLISTLTSADGYISAARDTEGFSAGSKVYVTLF